ncbi:DUF4870 domain-containing protein [Dokdonia ponticola]|uniref:DUF4870 domain-containing protein n=1 Tax=Dokdonia ponticola TaxID=2041041 RepID=A0ABV9HTE1_9FLAO
MKTPTSDEKTTAIIAYVTFIGLIIAMVMNDAQRSNLVSYHIRNMIGLSLISAGFGVLGWIGFPGLLLSGFGIVLMILWFIGFVGALKGEKQEIPVLGKYFQDWFKSI